MKLLEALVASSLLCTSFTIQAEDMEAVEEDVFDLMLSAGVTFGGDDLATTTGGVSVTSGGLIYLAAGGVWHASPNLDVQAALGYHFDTVSAENGTADFTRTFIEVMPMYVMDSGHRIGLGYTNIMSPKLSYPSSLGTPPEFKDANGVMVEFDFPLGTNGYLGIRYADISYESANGLIILPGGGITDSIDGSYLGIMLQLNI